MSKVANCTLGSCAALVAFVWWNATYNTGISNDPDPQPATSNVVAPAPAAAVVPVPQEAAAEDVAPKEVAAKYPIQSCKAAIAVIMGRDPKIISGKKLGDEMVHVSYRRPDDGKRWEARCQMVGDNRLQWAAFNAFGDGQMGRWRTEDNINVAIADGRLKVDVDQSGVMEKSESFDLKSLS